MSASNSTFIGQNNFTTNLIENFIKERYAGFPLKGMEWKKLGYDTIQSDKYQEVFMSDDMLQMPTIVGNGIAPEMQIMQERFQQIFQPVVVATGFQIDETALDDGKGMDLLQKYTAQIPNAFNKTRELLAVIPFNSGYSNTGWDNVSTFNSAHPLPQTSGTQTNILSTPTPLSKTAVQSLLTVINTSKDYSGYESNRTGKRLIVHPNNEWIAKEITASPYNPDTANNAINAIFNVLPEGYATNRYLSNTSNWYILTDEPMGLTHIERRALRIRSEEKIAERLEMTLADERYAIGIINPFALFGSGNNI